MEWTVLIWIGVILALLLIVIVAYDSNRFILAEYKICSDKIKKHSKVVLLSDLHNKCYGKDNIRLKQAIDMIAPDMILVAGDMMTSNEERTTYSVPIHLMKHLASRYPVFYANGNHEYRMKTYTEKYGSMYQDYTGQLKSCGVHLLENERIFLPESNVEICGLEIERQYYRRFYHRPMREQYVEELLGASREDCFEILIAHNPDYFKEYVQWGADLTVSGHIHGGVVRLPFLGGVISPMMRFFPKYDGGRFVQQEKTMILSRGLGMHTIPVRMFNPGELIVIHLE